jgi:hypothetical protein
MIVDDLRDIWDERGPQIVVVAVVVLVVGLVGLWLKLAIDDDRRWEQFKLTHKCKVVSYQSSSSSVGYGTTSDGKSGTVIVTEPSRTGWLCDDGITYYR